MWIKQDVTSAVGHVKVYGIKRSWKVKRTESIAQIKRPTPVAFSQRVIWAKPFHWDHLGKARQ